MEVEAEAVEAEGSADDIADEASEGVAGAGVSCLAPPTVAKRSV
jgi:hypothetical protein